MSARLARDARFQLLLALAAGALFAFANLRSQIVNEDGVLYLLLAQRIGDAGLGAAFAQYDRPFYSWAIAAIHAVTGLSLAQSARCLGALFCVLLAMAFADFCRLLYEDHRVRPWAALLLLAHPKIANYLAFVFRDLGYWALLFASFCAWLRLISGRRARWLATWAACTLLAAALRPEALLFGVLLPPTLLLAPGMTRRMALRRMLGGWTLLCAALALAHGLASLDPSTFAQPLQLAQDAPGTLWREIPAHFIAASRRYAAQVLDPQSSDVAALSLAGGLLTILVAKVLNGLGPVQVLLLGYALWRGRVAPVAEHRPAFLAMTGGGALLAAGFLAYRHFLDTRYVMLLCLLALAPAARALQLLAEAAHARGASAWRAFAAAVCVVFALDLGLGLDRAKPYLEECAAWLRRNVPPGSAVFGNDKQLAWESGGRWDYDTVYNGDLLIARREAPLVAGAYWIVHTRRGQDELAQALDYYLPRLQPLKRCENPGGGRITVYAAAPAP